MPPQSDTRHRTEKGLHFTATSWTEVIAASRAGTPEGAAALEKLCGTYWYPVYAYIRRRGFDSYKAQDLTQEFFYRVIRDNYLGAADRRKGRFRTFLLVVLNRFLANEYDREQAFKRGGGKEVLSLDEQDAEGRYVLEPTSDLSPEKIYHLTWFRTLVDQVLVRLREENVAAGKGQMFDRLKDFLDEDPKYGVYGELAKELGMSANALAVAVYRLKQRYHELVREEIARTVARPQEAETEIRHLFRVLA